MRYSPKNHKWAVIQSGYCVFGTGRTREAAIADAVRNMDQTERPTVESVENELVSESNRVSGSLYVTNDAEEIRSYVENQ